MWGGPVASPVISHQSWRIAETLTEVAEAAAAAERLCLDAGADEGQALRIGLALDELAANALMHGAVEETAPDILAEVWVAGDMLNLRLSASGPGFDPRVREAPRPDRGELDDALGGRGLALVFAFADALTYRREGGANITEFSVARKASAAD